MVPGTLKGHKGSSVRRPCAARAQVIIKVNKKFLAGLEQEYTNWPAVHFGTILKDAAKTFRGPYTRFVNNYDQAESALTTIRIRHTGGSSSAPHRSAEGGLTGQQRVGYSRQRLLRHAPIARFAGRVQWSTVRLLTAVHPIPVAHPPPPSVAESGRALEHPQEE